MLDAKGGGGAQRVQSVGEHNGRRRVRHEVALQALSGDDGAQCAHYIRLGSGGILQAGAGGHDASGGVRVAHVVQVGGSLVQNGAVCGCCCGHVARLKRVGKGEEAK